MHTALGTQQSYQRCKVTCRAADGKQVAKGYVTDIESRGQRYITSRIDCGFTSIVYDKSGGAAGDAGVTDSVVTA